MTLTLPDPNPGEQFVVTPTKPVRVVGYVLTDRSESGKFKARWLDTSLPETLDPGEPATFVACATEDRRWWERRG